MAAAKFPAYDGSESGGKENMFDRAQKRAKSTNIARPKDEDMGDQAPKGKRVKLNRPNRPERPSTKIDRKAREVSPEVEKGQSISQALLKGAAMVPDSPVSGTLRGLLGGASVGMDIGNAMKQYSQRKKDETAAAAAMKMNAPTQMGQTPSNMPVGGMGEPAPVRKKGRPESELEE